VKVVYASYHAVSILRGGPRTQMLNTARYLQENAVQVSFFDQWRPLNRGDVDLVHLFAANIGTYHFAREVYSLGIPLVVSPITFTTHSTGFVRRASWATSQLAKIGTGLWSDYGITADICRWASWVLPNTHAEADLLVNGLGVDRRKVTVIPNGVDDRFANADPAPFVRAYGMKDFILNVGHIGHTRKNVLNLIRALEKIDRPAVIIGRSISGSYGDACRRAAARNPRVFLIEGLDYESELLSSAYAACDTFVLPSQFETPGIAALEAGLAGAKVVITPHGGTREYFGAMAEYVEPSSVGSIRRGILRALRRKKDAGLRDHIRTHFLWQSVAALTARAYADVLRTRPG
jgi:glycosyltransferase involved in cell wall biosynthesis